MKALTLWQPWATLVAIRAKKIETRSWYTDYRGPLAIHAAKHMARWVPELCATFPFREVLLGAGYGNGVVTISLMPKGAIVATCTLRAVVKIIEAQDIQGLGVQEKAFGDFTPGRYAWFLDDIEELLEPVPTRGKQGLWEWGGTVDEV